MTAAASVLAARCSLYLVLAGREGRWGAASMILVLRYYALCCVELVSSAHLLLRVKRVVFSCSLRVSDKYGKEKLPLVNSSSLKDLQMFARFFVRYANI